MTAPKIVVLQLPSYTRGRNATMTPDQPRKHQEPVLHIGDPTFIQRLKCSLGFHEWDYIGRLHALFGCEEYDLYYCWNCWTSKKVKVVEVIRHVE